MAIPQSQNAAMLPRATAAVSVAAGFGVLVLAAVTSRWLLLAVGALLLFAPLLRHVAALRLVKTSPLPADELEFPRMVQLMSMGNAQIPRVAIRTVATEHAVAYVSGWPGGQTLTVSDGLLHDEDVGAIKGVIARELHRTTTPVAALDGFVWMLPIAALLVAVFRLGTGAFGVTVSLLALAVALAAFGVHVYGRELQSDAGAATLIDADHEVAVADGIERLDAAPPRGPRWWPMVLLFLAMPASRWLRGFVHPDAAGRAAQIRAAQAANVREAPARPTPIRSVDETATATDDDEVPDEARDPAAKERDPTATAVFLSVLGVLALLLVLALSTLGGGGSAGGGGTTTQAKADTDAEAGTTSTGTSTEPSRTDTNVCPSGSNGKPDDPVLIDGDVWTQGTDLLWRVLWCDDADRGDAWVLLHLAYDSPRRSRRIIRRKITSRSHPVEVRFRVVPAHLGIAPGRYRWTLIVRDVNANTDRIRGTQTIYVPGIP
ncbi:MAG: hypothetical protein R2878_08210 [Thermoleophilia bacterium]